MENKFLGFAIIANLITIFITVLVTLVTIEANDQPYSIYTLSDILTVSNKKVIQETDGIHFFHTNSERNQWIEEFTAKENLESLELIIDQDQEKAVIYKNGKEIYNFNKVEKILTKDNIEQIELYNIQ